MGCQARHSWTFTGLVGAFLDLAIAYFLLCGSTIAYFASKFLGFFGLDLPCPCNGLFGIPNNGYCLRRFLVDCPTEKISNVQLSAKSSLPFDSIWATEQNREINAEVQNGKLCREGNVGLEGEASCSLISDARAMQGESLSKNETTDLGVMNSPLSEDGKFDIKGKRVANQRSRSGLRRRRKGNIDYTKLSSIGSYDPLQSIVPGVSRSSSSVNKEIEEESLVHVSFNRSDGWKEGEVIPIDIGLCESIPNGFKLDEASNERKLTNMDASFMEELKKSVEGESGFNDREKNKTRFLEQALEEERAACTALYLELDKERNAAASAADEAMAMILRLQEEKASIEMEARQYKRMIEEKYAYDVEEMNLLKEILIRREREKHFLEKEVEAYRQIIMENEQSDGDIGDSVNQQGQGASSSSYLSEDPVLMLQKINESIESNEKLKHASRFSDSEVRYEESQNCTLSHGNELPICKKDQILDISKQGDVQTHPSCDEELFQEKGVHMDPGFGYENNDIPLSKMEQRDKSSLSLAFAQQMSENHKDTEINMILNGYDAEKCVKVIDDRSGGPHGSTADTKTRVLDVHVIDDEASYNNDINGNTSKRVSIDTSGDSHSTNRLDSGCTIKNKLRSSSGVPPIGTSRGKALLSDLRRYSMSAVDYERLKIDTEVECLRERLRTVQESKEKLNFSAEHAERDKIQLQLLEDIASQLREIRHFTGSGRAVRQASLPLPPSKAVSKKRRYRSVSLGVQHST